MILWWLKWIFNKATGNLAGLLAGAYDAKLRAATEDKRIQADVLIKDIEQRIEASRNAKEIRLATAGFWEMRVITAAIALPFVVHLWAVGLDTILKLGWRIPAYPSPFDEWQGAILLSFFGLQAAGLGIYAALAAFRGRK